MNIEELTSSTALTPVLTHASPSDLAVLVDYITDSGDGRMSLANSTCSQLIAAQARAEYPAVVRNVIADEILAFGGNTLGNMVRSLRSSVPFGSMLDGVLPAITEKVSYAEVVRDVASHLKVDVAKDASVLSIETAILMKIMQDSFQRMTPEQRREAIDTIGAGETVWMPGVAAATLIAGRLSGVASYNLASLVARSAAGALVGRTLGVAVTGGTARALGALVGPIGWAITGLWTLADLSAPAYRVTVPCVIQVAYIRQQLLLQATHHECKCGVQVGNSVKFCPDCGAPQAGAA